MSSERYWITGLVFSVFVLDVTNVVCSVIICYRAFITQYAFGWGLTLA
jgi:hypothetical protein